jgi:hypothetical protein
VGDAWLSGVQRVPNAKSEGGTYVAGVPWRWVGHTTEVIPSSVAGAVALAGRHEFPPHLWGWPERDWLVQTVRLDRSAFALKHPSGTPATNKMRALQIEIIGYARDMGGKPDSFWDWIGERVVRPLIDAGYAIDLSNVAPTTGEDGLGTGGAVRMSRAAWVSFDGLCVHANVPDNAHWDMGRADLARIAQAAAGGGGDDDMTTPAETEQIIRKVLNEGTLAGQDNWADTCRTTLSTVQGHTNQLNVISTKIDALPQKVADLIPAGGGATPAQIEAACRAAINAELGFLKPGQ